MNNKGKEDEPREQVAVVSWYAQHIGSARYNWEKIMQSQGGIRNGKAWRVVLNVVEEWLHGLKLFHINVESVAQIYQDAKILFVVTGAKLPEFTSYRMVV